MIFLHHAVLVMTSQAIHNNVVPSEVGWQFVPQYYTYVNKQPQRLHCFYTKSSTFIHGTEGEDGKPAFGQQVHIRIITATLDPGSDSLPSLRKFTIVLPPLVSRTARFLFTPSTLSLLRMVVSLSRSLVKCPIVGRLGKSLFRRSSLRNSQMDTSS